MYQNRPFEILVYNRVTDKLGPRVSHWPGDAHFYVDGMEAFVIRLEKEKKEVVLGWEVETSEAWISKEQTLTYEQYLALLCDITDG